MIYLVAPAPVRRADLLTMKLHTLAALLLIGAPVLAHDTWVETNTNVYRVGDVAHVDLKLGNHGNDHRDFKLAALTPLESTQIEIVAPDNRKYDLKPNLVGTAMAPKEGYWAGDFTNNAPGLYCVHQSFDAVMSYAPERAVKSAKTFFLASVSLDNVPAQTPGFDRALGDALEIVPQSNPVAPMGMGNSLKLRLLFKGQPLANTKLSFIPRGAQLNEGFDPRYESLTDRNGDATFTPNQAKTHLAVAHVETKEAGEMNGQKYDFTKYSATLTVYVPAICACCDE